MRTKLKPFSCHVQFQAVHIVVLAKNQQEAKKKMRARVAKLKPVRLLDKQNTFITNY
jgi:hypothetical protein